jgi:hypothetical protein
MAIATNRSGATAQVAVRVSTERGWTPQVVRVVTGRCEPAVEHWLDQRVILFQEPGDAQEQAVPPMTRPQPSGGASVSHASQMCTCPEWHILRLFGWRRGRVSFETCDEKLSSTAINGVCQVCGYGLRVDLGRH